jgi:hypothetical protein
MSGKAMRGRSTQWNDAKLILAWHLVRRNRQDTEIFIEKLNDATFGDFH